MDKTEPLDENTIRIDRREGLWRMRVYPHFVQLFGSREQAEAQAQEIACSKVPAWTVIVHAEDENG